MCLFYFSYLAIEQEDLTVNNDWLEGETNYASCIIRHTNTYSGLNNCDLKDEFVILEAYKEDLMKFTQRDAWAGMWQIYQMCNVIQRPIVSVFPELPADSVYFQVFRLDYFRIITPKTPSQRKPAFIMWTKTGKTATGFSHFVPLVK